MFRSRSWFSGSLWKPKNLHSLEHLKYLYNILSKNQTVSENNRGLLVETLRSIAEILIWGDQNDSSVFDFFLEKNMLSFFLQIMKQKCGSYVCVQLLQTLNILFENIRNETSLYYLLSNNHVNHIIIHKFDFSDEEVMAYYISFLKTLSLKLNAHTIHFFYNEVNKHTNDFPLYTEAIKFFNHSEGMVRIAVRTLTLNVYKVDDVSMLKFIRDRTAAPYFSNLVWFIGNNILELDSCIRNDADHQSQNRLSDLVAEHLDHLHYLNDILCLNIQDLNEVLSEHLLNKLLVPLYVYSLTKRGDLCDHNDKEKKNVSTVLALFLLSQVFLIISHAPLVRILATVIFNSDVESIKNELTVLFEDLENTVYNSKIAFSPPEDYINEHLENFYTPEDNEQICIESQITAISEEEIKANDETVNASFPVNISTKTPIHSCNKKCNIVDLVCNEDSVIRGTVKLMGKLEDLNVTDEEKEKMLGHEITLPLQEANVLKKGLEDNKIFLETILDSLNCIENDYAAMLSLCLLYALGNNPGVSTESLGLPLKASKLHSKNRYHEILVQRLVQIIILSCQTNTKVRLITLELAVKLLIDIAVTEDEILLEDAQFAAVEGAKEQSAALLRNIYKSEDIFLDMFEDEYSEIKKKPLNVEWLMMDSNVLLPPTGTPMTGIEFNKRLPCGEVERARRAIRVFFLIRELSLALNLEAETHLPLTSPSSCVKINNVLDLNNSDLIACTVVSKDGAKIRRFLVIDVMQLILVEPDTRKLGWGVAKFVGFLQDIEVVGDKDDSRSIHLTVHKPSSASSVTRIPLLSAKFIFDDHIRCMAAKQRLTKGRIKARQRKMNQIAKLLDMPHNSSQSTPPMNYMLVASQNDSSAGRGQKQKEQQRQMFNVNKVPGFAAQLSQERKAGYDYSHQNRKLEETNNTITVKSDEHANKTCDNSPKLPSAKNEEIPLEYMRTRKASHESNAFTLSVDQTLIVSNVPLNEESSTSGKSSEETSFTSLVTYEKRTRRKGKVETV